jgi:mannose-6-phosphate isomerase-like protein (cupin superfamily)
MTQLPTQIAGTPLSASRIFTREGHAAFAASYPETPHKLTHSLRDHPLMTIEALAQLGESLPERSVEYYRGDVEIGTRKPGSNGLTVGETIRSVETSRSWVVLKRIEQNPAYAALLAELLGELEHEITGTTGRMLETRGFIFVSSPDAVTPYHFDPEHNILLQLSGHKTMTVFPANDARFVADRVHEVFHAGGGRELTWRDELDRQGTPFPLAPGEALYVPVMAPHYVKNGPAPSISLSITWRSEWSFAEADARAFNGWLRKLGLQPRPPGRWPARNTGKAIAWRLLRRLPGIR